MIKWMIRLASAAAVWGCIAVSAFAGTAQAETVTVGASLLAPLFGAGACAEGREGESAVLSCGFVTMNAGAPSSAMVADADGTVTSWRVLDASAVPGYSVNVVREHPGGAWTVTASSEEVTPVESPGVQTFPTDLPIHAGEYIELNIPNGGRFNAVLGVSRYSGFQPGLAAGESRLANFPTSPFPENGFVTELVFAYNADIEYPSPAPPVVSPTVAPTTSSQAAPAENAVGPTAGCVVPKVVGKKLRSARKLLRKANCRIGLVSTKDGAAPATGRVVRQSPNPGKVVPAHAPVSLRLGHA